MTSPDQIQTFDLNQSELIWFEKQTHIADGNKEEKAIFHMVDIIFLKKLQLNCMPIQFRH